ncbi:TerC family protein [Brevibacillus migulae]|uniref:TerC family protein n=1 Tax=Brevibacillus migulae TaxID=1644114 RepID=UPI00106EC323|nr:TerC family protein [Brevibacillus migulae]
MAEWLLDLSKIILVNIVLSGDNAVVIALACRNLKPEVQKKAVFWGSFGAIALRVILTFVAVWLLKVPLVETLGGLLLLWIAVKLLAGEEEGDNITGGSSIREAIKTIIIADLVMSLDNVVAVAGAANGDLTLILIGLAVSIPLIIWGSQLLMKIMQRFPIIVLLGAALLGYTAGEMIMGDKIVGSYIEHLWHGFEIAFPIGLAVLVVIIGKWLAARHGKHEEDSADSAELRKNA